MPCGGVAPCLPARGGGSGDGMKPCLNAERMEPQRNEGGAGKLRGDFPYALWGRVKKGLGRSGAVRSEGQGLFAGGRNALFFSHYDMIFGKSASDFFM